MKKNDYDKDEAIAWIVVRSIIGAVATLFIIYGLILKQPCDSDAVFTSCRLTGSVGDYIGVPLFLLGCFTISGWPEALFKGFKYLYTPINSNGYAILAFVATALGIVLFWNL